jgi:hypothetical protein
MSANSTSSAAARAHHNCAHPPLGTESAIDGGLPRDTRSTSTTTDHLRIGGKSDLGKRL